MHGKQCDYKPVPSFHEVQKNLKGYAEAQDQLMRNAQEDLFKHFRMNASLRAMKRGDGILSDTFALVDEAAAQGNQNQEVVPYIDREMTLIDMETSLKAREDMHLHFWRAHESRKEITAQHKVDDEASVQEVKSDMISPHGVYPEKTRSRTPLPSSLQDIQMEFVIHAHHSKSRAIAITEPHPPFKIVDVNAAWVDLCGYSRKHAIGSTLKLLQGPETNVEAANKLATFLLAEKDGKQTPHNNEYETVLTNYRSDGKRFRNHIRVGLVKDETGNTVNFVGVFQKLDDNDELII
jgi:PAS domain S-box-containing protein